ncbi:HAD family hydrolase [Aeoliella sp. ICT_H6.2]|uniref:HAD family hydrolase n=1 Tax=Aeoliella straminimaris TaxID=2954799 RepID=A0A9X2JH77_9BACT|nr:HAD-IIB family hydrolase [Aeoliella straminimaris]MCO6042614.1 HAD family hydrolase [Aeoliella straminimaris]
MQILATDLDRTLLPNGRWKADESAIPLFNELTEKHNTLVVYVTGRNLKLTERAIREYGVRYPHYLCGDVGTTIRKYEHGRWQDDAGWVEHVKRSSPRWDAASIRQVVAEVQGIREQEEEHQNQFKQSYYVEHEKKDDVLRQVESLIKGKFDEVIIYSFDSQDGKGLLDFLPNSATKQTALEYVAASFEVAKHEVVFCGDSGNDIFPLTAGFRGVLVKNADDQLLENVRNALDQDPSLQAFFAKGDFMGLSGYYTSGVIEGAYHYGIFG